MTNISSREQRSQIMRSVKSTNTSLELRLRKVLWQGGLRYRLYIDSLPGKPDITFKRRKLAVFVDSCFFHGCDIHLRRPKSNQDYWNAKIARNIQRDQAVNAQFRDMGWRVIRLWEHEIMADVEGCADRIQSTLLIGTQEK